MTDLSTKKLILIAGPTAAGKTAMAIRIAQHFHTSIISADSRQCYKEMKIGVARPSDEELSAVPHFFIASHSIQEDVTAAVFESYALEKAAELFKTHDVVVMVGGTGLYIRAFCEGLDLIPEIPAGIREKIIASYEANGIGWLQQELNLRDPLFAEKGEMQNPQRMMRALEVVEATGHSIFSFRRNEKTSRDFEIIKIGLTLPRDILRQRIDERVDQMMKAGLEAEVRELRPNRHLNALQTVGYQEIFEYLEGKCRLEDAVERVKINTRQYAKRQMTWFNRDPEMHWFVPDEWDKILQFIDTSV